MASNLYFGRILVLILAIIFILIFLINSDILNARILSHISYTSYKPNKVLVRDLYSNYTVQDSPKDFCLGKEFLVLAAVHSLPENLSYRLAIRNTWGRYAFSLDIKIIFVIGTSKNLDTNDEVAEEKRIYNDIIQGDFIDNYFNQTLKMIYTLDWIKEFCPQPYFILKLEDDTHVNVHLLQKVLKDRTDDKKSIYGNFITDSELLRSGRKKMALIEHNDHTERPLSFSSATAYFFTRDVVEEMYFNALDLVYTSQENIFITGTVAESLNLVKVEIPKFCNQLISFDPCFYSEDSICARFASPGEQYELWQKLQNCSKSKILFFLKRAIYAILN